MLNHNLRWFHCGPPVSDLRIEEVQANLGVRLPSGFLDWVRGCDGGRCEPCVFDFVHPDNGSIITSSIGYLFSFRAPMDPFLKRIYRNDPDLWRTMDIEPWWTIEDENLWERPEHFPRGLIGFADNGFGDQICFDYRSGTDNSNPPVVFWLHELDPNPIALIANDFDTFAASLRADEVG
jgi:hypothetical protein